MKERERKKKKEIERYNVKDWIRTRQARASEHKERASEGNLLTVSLSSISYLQTPK